MPSSAKRPKPSLKRSRKKPRSNTWVSTLKQERKWRRLKLQPRLPSLSQQPSLLLVLVLVLMPVLSRKV
jgi:hypothetical protein